MEFHFLIDLFSDLLWLLFSHAENAPRKRKFYEKIREEYNYANYLQFENIIICIS